MLNAGTQLPSFRWQRVFTWLCRTGSLSGFSQRGSYFLAFPFLAVVLQVHGQPSEDAVRRMHPLVNLPPRGEVSTKYVLPEHPQKLFPAGEVVRTGGPKE